MVKRPGELVSRMRIDGLEQAKDDPNVHRQDMQIFCDCTPDDWTDDRTEAEEQHFDRACVFCSKTEWGGVLVVYLMDHLVELGGVKGTVRPVVPCVLHDEEDGDLVSHCKDGRKGHGG